MYTKRVTLLFNTFYLALSQKYRTLSKKADIAISRLFMSMEACIVVSAPSPPFSPLYRRCVKMCLFYRDEATFRVNGLTPPFIKLGGLNLNPPLSLFPNAKSLGVVKSWEAIESESANSQVLLDEQITTFRAKICYCGWLVPVKSPQSKLLFAIIHDIELRVPGELVGYKAIF